MGAEIVNAGAISANIDAIAAIVSDVVDLADKQTTQGIDITANRVDIDYLLAQQPAADYYIFLQGVSAYINFTAGGDDLLDFTKSWSVGISLEGLPDNPVDNFSLALFGSGQASLALKRGAPPGGPGQWPSYNTTAWNLYDTAARFNSNVWYPIGPSSRVLYTYDHTTKRLAYWLQEQAGGTFARRAFILVPDTAIAAQVVGPGFCFGKAWTGPGGDLFTGHFWNGG